MRIKNKLVSFLLLATIGLSGCDLLTFLKNKNEDEVNDNQEQAQHVHTYENDWSFDETFHWHAATCEHVEETKDKSEHIFSDWIIEKEATYLAEGLRSKTCTICNYKVSEQIDVVPHEHNYGDWITDQEPTETNEGIKHRICSICNHKEEDFIDALGTLDKLSFTYLNNGTACGVSMKSSSIEGEVVIPATFHDLPVTIVNEKGFRFCDNITSVKFGSNIWKISKLAFDGCDNLSLVRIRNTITVIESFAFHSVENTEYYGTYDSWMKLDGRDNLTGNVHLFINGIRDEVKKINVSDGTINLPMYAFYHCTSLTEVNLPNTLQKIDYYSFGMCNSLVSINIPESVLEIENCAFESCLGLKEVRIPDSVTRIGKRAFCGCESLETFVMGSGVTTIGDELFYHSYSLKKVFFGKNLSTIGTNLFSSCAKIEIFEVDVENLYFSSQNNVLFSKDKSILIEACESISGVYEIPESVTQISNAAFSGCKLLTSVTIPNSVITLGDGAFSHCEMLESVNIGNAISTIPLFVFDHCYCLKNVTIGSAVAIIKQRAFESCSGLEYISIPNNVTEIELGAFFNCSSLKRIEIPFIGENLSTNTFFTYIFGSNSASNPNVPNTLETVMISEPCQIITHFAFENCSSIKSITLPKSLTNIESFAFSGCALLSELNYDGTVLEWGQITLETNWNLNTTVSVVHCTDGDINI